MDVRKTAIGCFLFWDAAKRILINTYRRFGTTYRSHLQGYSGPRNIGISLQLYFPEQGRPHLFVAEFRSQIVTISLYIRIHVYIWSDNKVRELATVCLPWQHWTKTLVWFDDVDISAFHSCVVDLWQSLSEWYLLLCACVLVCRRENVGA